MSSSSESVFGSFPTGSYSVAGLTLKLKSDDSAKDNRQAAVARRGSVLAAFLSLPHRSSSGWCPSPHGRALAFPAEAQRRDGGWRGRASAVALVRLEEAAN